MFGEPLKLFAHTVFVPTIETVGNVTTNTFATAVFVQPKGPVTVTV